MRKTYRNLDQRKRRAYQLKYRVIPRDEAEVMRLQNLLKTARNRLRIDKNELHNLQADFNEEVTPSTFLETLKEKSRLGKPKGIKIPKSIGGKGE